jgi:ribonuclease HI
MDGINKWLPDWKSRNWITANKKPVKNRDLWELLDKAVTEHKIEWNWVKGHTGNIGNEQADALANQGIDELE